VLQDDLATFEAGNVHPFYSTFALGRDVEWACRQFVLNMKDDDEEGIGTFLNINHKSPAMLGDQVTISAKIIHLHGNTVDCEFSVKVGERLIADGTQGQKILKKEKLARIVAELTGG
jgi:predicted thioesterase